MKGIEVCRMCRDPVSSPISQNVIADSVIKWLPQKVSKDFKAFNSSLVERMNSYFDRDLPANAKEVLVCSYCYVKEAYQWLADNSPGLEERFLRVFSFGFNKASIKGEMEIKPPREMEERIKEFGICDECGSYSDSLSYRDGEWLCIDCEKFG